jgi:hypothetical protein
MCRQLGIASYMKAAITLVRSESFSLGAFSAYLAICGDGLALSLSVD